MKVRRRKYEHMRRRRVTFTHIKISSDGWLRVYPGHWVRPFNVPTKGIEGLRKLPKGQP